MKTVVIQSYRRTQVPDWIARCMQSVRSWANARGYDYQFADDSSFALCGPFYLEAAGGNLRTITNLTRLILARDALAGPYLRAIWLDADMFVFSPERFAIDIDYRYAFARETFLRRMSDEQWFAYTGVNNSAFVFHRGEPDLPFLINTIHHIAEHRTIQTNYQVGGELLKGLRISLGFATLSNVGMFSADIVCALNNPGDPILPAQARFHQTPVYAANLCASENYERNVTEAEAMGAMDALEGSSGDVLNRWLAQGPLSAEPYPGRTFFSVNPMPGGAHGLRASGRSADRSF